MKNSRHSAKHVMRAATLFFEVRGVVRTRLAQGRRLDPYAWLRIETLVHIRDHSGLSMSDLATYLSITPPSATSLVSALEKAGLVIRKLDARDRRALRVSLTSKGEATLKVAVARGMRIFEKLFASLSPRELAAFTRALERIRA